MKKLLLLVLTGLFAAATVNSQSVDEIVKKYSASINADKLSSFSTIKITGKMSTMGMDIPMTMYMKNPNKIKAVYSINGMEMISLFDGQKGYMVNPMTGSSDPVELTGDQLEQIQNSSAFKNMLNDYLKSGKLTLEGEENVNDKPAFKLKADIGGSPRYMYIDKENYLMNKLKFNVEQGGQSMDVEVFLSDYTNVDGVVMPKKTTSRANGMEISVMTYDTIEVNTPMDDTIFKLK
jgi:hypothetical protein